MKRLFAIVASAIITLTGQLAAQTINISTSSMDGWSIDNNSTFHINTWSTEGNSDGSGMTTPFLENWVANGNFLPAGTWSYTATGLTANAYYSVSALVRAYNERSSTYPSGVYLYAGDYESADISTGTAIRYNNQSSGRYATLSAIGQADANGNLTIGIHSYSGTTNWVAMKNVTLTKLNNYSRQIPQFNVWSQFGSITTVNQSSSIGYYRDGNGAVTFTTSDASVAKVTSDGTITCVGAGFVTITCHLAATSTYVSATRTIQLSVKQDWDSQLTPTLSLAIAYNQLYVGDKLATTLTYNGDGAVTYTSSNTNVATVSADGFVTAVGAGSATSTAQAASTSNYDAATTTLAVTVASANATIATATYGRITGAANLTSGEYLIVSNSSPNYALDASVANEIAKREVSISANVITTFDDRAFILEGSNGNFTASAKKNDYYLAPRTSTDIYSLTAKPLEIAADGDYFTIRNTTDSRYLNYNSAGAFQASSTTARRFMLFRQTSALTLLAFPERSYSVILADGFTAPTVGNPRSLAVTYTSSNAEVATVNASTGAVTLVGEGTTVITANATFNGEAIAVSYTLNVSRLTPQVTLSAEMLTLTSGTVEYFTADLGDYDGTPLATVANPSIASVGEYAVSGSMRTYSVYGHVEGLTTVTLTLPATARYSETSVTIPVTVLSNIFTYNLVIENAPQYGVSIEIWGVTYSASATFTSTRSTITASDVVVKALANYTTSVTIDGRTVTVTYALKMPELATFIRLKNYSCNRYASISADGAALTVAAQGEENIIYYDEAGHFLFYKNGQYVKATNVMASVADAPLASSYTFTQGTGEHAACFSIRTADGKYLLASADGTSTSSVADNDYAFWYVETLSTLPVATTVAGFGYATLYSPVALEIPGGISAYCVPSKSQIEGKTGVEYELTLEPLVSVIPARTPVILVGTPGTTYDCTLQYDNTDAPRTSDSGITGHCAAQVTTTVAGSGTLYALQPNTNDETVGFYRYSQPNTKGFKSYFVSTSTQPAASIRLIFADGNETALRATSVQPVANDTAVYNICGQRVGDSLEGLRPGIYIRGGRKVIVR